MADVNPFPAGPYRLRVGTRPLDPSQWLVADDQRVTQMARKSELLRTRHGEVFRALTGSEAAGAELLEAVRAADGPGAGGERNADMHPVDLAGRLVQEDLCLLEDLGDGPVLTAGSVCFPNRWRLADKIGHPLAAMHGPVPGYGDRIGAATDKVLARLAASKPVWRLNWSLLDDPELFQPDRLPAADAVTVDDVGDLIHLRVERQTLSRLARSGAIVFTVHTTVRPLRDIAGRGDVLASMAATLRTMPPEALAYKDLTGSRDAIVAWADALVTRVPG